MKIKNCPFCNSKAELSDTMGLHPQIYLFVQCTGCKARSPEILTKRFCDMSNFKVEDFNRNPQLRLTINVRHKEHLNEIRELAIRKWNKRWKEDNVNENNM